MVLDIPTTSIARPATVTQPARRSFRDIVDEVSARLCAARTTGQVDGFVESMKELDSAWRCTRGDIPTAELDGIRAELSSLFEGLKHLIDEKASRHADVVMRPRYYYAAKRTVPVWQGAM
jgi:hypothetical protein